MSYLLACQGIEIAESRDIMLERTEEALWSNPYIISAASLTGAHPSLLEEL